MIDWNCLTYVYIHTFANFQSIVKVQANCQFSFINALSTFSDSKSVFSIRLSFPGPSHILSKHVCKFLYIKTYFSIISIIEILIFWEINFIFTALFLNVKTYLYLKV